MVLDCQVSHQKIPEKVITRVQHVLIPIIAILFFLSLASCSQAISAPRQALVFGINKYTNLGERNFLQYCVADASSMASLFMDQDYESVLLGTDQNATKEKIHTAISTASLSPDTLMVLYFSGHGSVENGEYYILPQDSTWDKSTWISAGELSSWLSGSLTDNIVVILDACYSGGFIGETADSIDTSPGEIYGNKIPAFPVSAITHFVELLERNASTSGRLSPIVLTASGSAEQSWEPLNSHGVFTNFILESANSGDLNGDGLITVTEAFFYAKEGIRSFWNDDSYSDFLPHISGGSRDLVLFSGN